MSPDISDPPILQANLQALKSRLGPTHSSIIASSPPISTEFVSGRDGSPTFAWRDDAGAMHWLGRTTMPTTRAAALVESFQPGTDNVFIDGLGQGMEVRLLLTKLAPFQAVIVVEPCAWAAKLCLQLHDFSPEILDGRLLLFAGDDGWTQMVRHLASSPGYMTPRRILSWPWLDHASAGELSERVAQANATIEQDRLARSGKATTTLRYGHDKNPVLAIVSNRPSAAVRRDAACLACAADQLGWTHRKFVLDGPAVVHPGFVQDELACLRPTLIVALDSFPSELPYQLPASARVVRLSRTDPDYAFTPAATVIENRSIVREKSQRIIVLADRVDCSAAAAGLHLASHRKLWQLAEGIILARIDSYDDTHADDVLAQAQNRLEAKIENDGIRAGLIARIRSVLGPALVTMSHLRALSEAGLMFDLFGEGWENEPMAGATVRGCWPLPDRLADVVERAGIVVTIETGGRLTTGLLDAMAAGVAVMARSTPAIDASSGLREIFEGSWPIMRYHSRAELLALVRQVMENQSLGKVMADRARASVTERHTWRHRLQSLHASSLHELKSA